MTSFDVTYEVIGLPTLVVSIFGALVALMLFALMMKQPRGDANMIRIQDAIKEGALTFLKTEYMALAFLVAALFVLVTAAVNWRTGICYLVGVSTSALCGFIGMITAVNGNARTAEAAKSGLNAALRVAFNGGSVMGLTVVSLSLCALSVLLMIFRDEAFLGSNALAGFGMGASTLSIFARVGGGIFTKAADVGADLVAKVEHNIPEDDVRNPATIADNVGDNVGDVAGMGADLFGSFAGSIIASSLLAAKDDSLGKAGIALPFFISGSGIIAAIIGTMLVRTKEGANQGDLLVVLRRAQVTAGIIQIGFIALIIGVLDLSWKLFGCIVIGLAAGLLIAVLSEYMTSGAYYPTRSIAAAGTAGPAGVVIQGIAVGSMACVMPTLIVASVVLSALALANMYGIALASTGVLSTLAITLATDAYGPIADNAGGIAEMAHLPPHVRENTDVLDALGNTTAAVGKGFAVVSAILTGISLVSSFVTRVELTTVPDLVTDKYGLAGILVGAMLPYAFSALTMTAVGKSAQGVVYEVRRQFKEIPGLMEGTGKADYASCVKSIMTAALHAMVFPVLIVILSPLIFGIGLGPRFLIGMLIGIIVSGMQVGTMQNTAGGAWDNAKKMCENDLGIKRSDVHKACVVGDTIGDPFKDTSGPAVNILVKLSCYISVVLSPVFKNQADYWWVSLIIIGILMVFVPVWIRFDPGLGDLGIGVLEKYADEWKAQKAKAELNGEQTAIVLHSEEPAASSAPSAASSSSSAEAAAPAPVATEAAAPAPAAEEAAAPVAAEEVKVVEAEPKAVETA
jgi:H(+)-translocating pyrophosphatase